MIKQICINKPKYGKYFLFSEAPGDEKENTEVNTRDTTPDDYDSNFNDLSDDDFDNMTLDDVDDDIDTDFNALSDDDLNDASLDDQNDTNDAPNNNATNEPNINQNNTEPTDDPNQNQPADNPPENPDGNPNSPNDGTNTDGETPDDYSDMDTNFNDTPEDGEDMGTDTGVTDTTTSDAPKGPGVEYDSTRKYILYNKFMDLHTALGNYISKLENITIDDVEMNKILKTATIELREVRDLTFQYMTMKFTASTYVQSLLFYQQLIVSIQLIFKTVSMANKEFNKKDKK